MKVGLTRFREEQSVPQAKLESIHYILVHHLPSFCPCPKTFSEAECKNNGLICLVEEISR